MNVITAIAISDMLKWIRTTVDLDDQGDAVAYLEGNLSAMTPTAWDTADEWAEWTRMAIREHVARRSKWG